LHGIKCNWACRFPSGTKGEAGANVLGTSIASDVDIVVTWVVIVNDSETFTTYDKLFDVIKGRLIIRRPTQPVLFSGIGGE
jgi:hypothetical protein